MFATIFGCIVGLFGWMHRNGMEELTDLRGLSIWNPGYGISIIDELLPHPG